MKRTFGAEYKLRVVRELLRGEKSLSQMCREQGLGQNVLRRWRDLYQERGEEAFGETANGAQRSVDASDAGRVVREQAARIRALEQALGRAHLEVEFLRDALGKGGCPPGTRPL